MKDYRIVIKIKNNRILKYIYAAGYNSVGEFCRMNNFHASIIGEYVNLKLSPIQKRSGRWKNSVLNICKVLRCLPEDIFSDEQLKSLESNVKMIEMDKVDMLDHVLLPKNPEQLMIEVDRKTSIEGVLKTLTVREEKIIKMVFGLDPYGSEYTFREIAEQDGISVARIQQITSKALRKIRHPSRSKHLKEYIYND